MSAAVPAPPLERVLRILPVVLYLVFTWFASARGAEPMPDLLDDKVLHFGEYGLLALLLIFAFTGFDAEGVTAGALAAALALSIVWGFADEYHQSFVPTRESSGLDLVADAAGAAAGCALAAALAWRDRRRR
jgi:VanZ family protein